MSQNFSNNMELFNFLMREALGIIKGCDSCYNCQFQTRVYPDDKLVIQYCSKYEGFCYKTRNKNFPCVAWKKRTLLQKIKLYLQRRKEE